ncbi:MAG: hypothetical protein GXW85_03075 [Clostridia bacterium]|nr:hypothetical protein [Clostridia bacterium]
MPRIKALDQESFLPPAKEKETSKEGEEKPKEILEMRGSGFFKGDKLIGWLDEETTRGYLWVRGEVKGGVVVVENPVDPNAFISLEIKSSKSKIIPRIDKENIQIDINVSSSLNLVENAGSINVENEKTIRDLQQRAAEAIKKEIQKAVIKAQETKSDFLGMGEVVRALYPKVWEGLNWSEEVPFVDINIDVQVDVEEAAMTLGPVMLPSQRLK